MNRSFPSSVSFAYKCGCGWTGSLSGSCTAAGKFVSAGGYYCFQAQTQIFAAVVADVNVRIFPLIFAEPDLEKSSAGCCPVAAHAKGRCHQAGSCLTDDGGIAVDGLSVFQDIWNCLIVVGLAGGHLLIRK